MPKRDSAIHVLSGNAQRLRGLLDELFPRLIRQKDQAGAFGKTAVEITWECGRPEILRVRDEATHKLDS